MFSLFCAYDEIILGKQRICIFASPFYGRGMFLIDCRPNYSEFVNFLKNSIDLVNFVRYNAYNLDKVTWINIGGRFKV